MIIEEAIHRRLLDMIPSVKSYPVDAPENVKAAFIVYREIPGSDTEEGFYSTTQRDNFEFDISPGEGLTGGKYLEAKALANQVRTAFAGGFRIDDFCVDQVVVGKRQDSQNTSLKLYWVRAEFTFVYDTVR